MARTSSAPSAAAANAARDLKVMVSRLRRQLKEVSATEDLSASQASVLARLALIGPSSTSELAGAERIRPQSMAPILKVLEGRGLIERAPDPNDGRRQIISLTASGRDRGQGAQAMRDEWLVRALQKRYTDAERATILEALALLERLSNS
jgi:DNA-binding MarR family transcriptional regulator